MEVFNVMLSVVLIILAVGLLSVKVEHKQKFKCYEMNREKGIEQVDYCLNVLKTVKGID